MKSRHLSLSLIVMTAALAVFGAVGCTIHASTPSAVVVAPAPPPPHAVVVTAPPARVYHSGHWLHYRSDGYYYYHGGAWVVATSVPTHVARYHRPAHVRHVTHVRRGPEHRRAAPVHQTRVVHQGQRRVHHKLDWSKNPLDQHSTSAAKPPSAT